MEEERYYWKISQQACLLATGVYTLFTKLQLTEVLRSVGLKPADTVLVHSAASNIGGVEGGAEGILDVLCDYFAKAGLLAMPDPCSATA